MTPANLEQEELLEERLREGVVLGKITVTSLCKDFLSINDVIAIPVYPTSKYSVENCFDIPIRLSGRDIGTLCLISKINPSEDVITSLTEAQYAAYLTAIDLNGFVSGAWAQFNTDYVVIKSNELENYLKNQASAPLWGGFTHALDSTDVAKGKVSTTSLTLDITENCKPRTNRHQECLDLAAKATHATERFLHLYHYLELDYDYEVVKEIKRLDENDPKNLWDILKLSRDDVDRIYHILRDYNSISEIERFVSLLRHHEASALRIFYDYGKDSNPLKSEVAFSLLFLNAPAINRVELEKVKKSNSLSDNFVANETDYKNKLIKLVCYWVYRVRCSIAHNKLGEYHLNDSDDLEFLVDFAEPLLLEMIRFRMKSSM